MTQDQHRDALRPCWFHLNPSNRSPSPQWVFGYFHCWLPWNEDDASGISAVIEDGDGVVREVANGNVRFSADKPNEGA